MTDTYKRCLKCGKVFKNYEEPDKCIFCGRKEDVVDVDYGEEEKPRNYHRPSAR